MLKELPLHILSVFAEIIGESTVFTEKVRVVETDPQLLLTVNVAV